MPALSLPLLKAPILKLSESEKIALAEKIIGYEFKDKEIIWEALQVAGSGVTLIGARPIPEGNKRLALVGDRLAENIVTNEWYKTGGLLEIYDTAKKTITSDENFAHVARICGLYNTLNMNPRNHVPDSKEIMAALFEALLGAIFFDAGENIEPVRACMSRFHLTYKHWASENPQLVPKPTPAHPLHGQGASACTTATTALDATPRKSKRRAPVTKTKPSKEVANLTKLLIESLK